MRYERMLFVSWGANLGGVASSTYARMAGLRELGVASEKLFFKPGAGLDTFTDFPVYVTNSRRSFREIVRLRNYDAISLVNSTALLEALGRAGYGGRLVYEVRGLGSSNMKACARLSPSQVDGIVVPSRYVAGLVERALKGRRIPVRVVPNAVDTSRFHPVRRPDPSVIPEAARPTAPGGARLGYVRPIVLWVGRLDENKNWREMLEIIYRLRERGRDVQGWVVGDTNVASDEKGFWRRAAQMELQRYVHLLPCIPHAAMPDVYGLVAKSGGCVLSTSRSEGLQNSLLEAMACGCPVVSSAVGGNVEIVEDGVNGYLYRLGDPAEASDRIERALEPSRRRDELVRRALCEVHTKHAPRRHAKAFIEVLDSLAAEGGRAGRLRGAPAGSASGPSQWRTAAGWAGGTDSPAASPGSSAQGARSRRSARRRRRGRGADRSRSRRLRRARGGTARRSGRAGSRSHAGPGRVGSRRRSTRR